MGGEARTKPDTNGDDGLRGPVGEQVGVALLAVGEALGFRVRYPTAFAPWVDQPWDGRHLTIGRSSIGLPAATTGCRWITIELTRPDEGSASGRSLTTDGDRSGDDAVGHRLALDPRGPGLADDWIDDPPLGSDLWSFASRLCPWGLSDDPTDQDPWVQLHVRPDGVAWTLRAVLLDEALLAQAISLLGRVAAWVDVRGETLAAGARPVARPSGGRAGSGVSLLVLALLAAVMLVPLLIALL